jgi:NDP-sugar pyrophosphorylase family protein
VSVRPNLSFHAVSSRADGGVCEIKPVMETDLRVNGGFFLFRRQIFDYMRPGEELVQEPFGRLIKADQLLTHQHDGFTASMDTFKDKQHFDELYAKGKAPWEVWRRDAHIAAEGLNEIRAASAEHVSSDEKPAGVRYKGDTAFLGRIALRSPEPVAGSASELV